MMSMFLEEVATRHPDDLILMLMDQASWAQRPVNLKIPQNMRLVWLPAYSPQCNPVEHIWDDTRKVNGRTRCLIVWMQLGGTYYWTLW